jgi:hypothetical protein
VSCERNLKHFVVVCGAFWVLFCIHHGDHYIK